MLSSYVGCTRFPRAYQIWRLHIKSVVDKNWHIVFGKNNTNRGATLLRFLQIPAIPVNSCKFLQKFMHFAVVAGIQLSFFSDKLFDI